MYSCLISNKKVNKFSKNKPLLWIRYVDDVFCIFKNTQNIDQFLTRINKWHANIHFTVEFENQEKLAFLDVLIERDKKNNSYNTSLYRKPTNTNLYLLYESNQCREYKLGLIRTLVTRIYLICSTQELIEKEIELMKKTLTSNGYPSHLIRKGIREGQVISKRIINGNGKKKDHADNKLTIHFLLTYYGQESMILANRIKRTCKTLLPLVRINVCFRKALTLKRIFLPLQKGIDQSNKDKNLV